MPNRHSFRALFVLFLLLAGLIVVGCSDSDDEATTDDITGSDPTGGDGDVFVETEPEELNVPWALSLPGGGTVSGVNSYRLRDQDPGDYTISWPQLDGWNEPRPGTMMQTMDSGSNLSFHAIYLPQPGTTLVKVLPDGLVGSWRLFNDSGFDVSSSGDTTLVNLVPGDYGVEWTEVEGFETPESAIVSLSQLNPMLVIGEYSFPDSTVFVNPLPEETNAGWTIEGPNAFSVSGNGPTKVDLVDNGGYTLTWDAVDQYTTPESESVFVNLEPEKNFTATGLYIALEGTVNITAVLGGTDLPWALTGPSGTVQYGTGSASLTGMRSGTYSLQGESHDGWAPGMAQSGDLDVAGELALTLETEAAITVRPLPVELEAAWQLTGPDGYSLEGTGEMLVDGLTAGSYTITWTAISGWDIPAAGTETLAADNGLVFEGEFVQGAHSLHVNPRPASETITWEISGPGGYSETGDGRATLPLTEAGNYTVVWGDVDGYMTPVAKTVTFTGDNNVSLNANYLESLDMVSLLSGSLVMGSQGTENCRSAFETPHNVMLSSHFFMKETEVTNAEYIAMAQWAIENGYATASRFGVYDNIDGSTVELLDLDDGDQEIFFEGGYLTTSAPNHPVKEVSWYGAATYCDWVSLYMGLVPAYSHVTWICGIDGPSTAGGYRLPTEAEWEYACRAGSTSPFANNIVYNNSFFCASSDLETIAWYELNSGGWSSDVGQLVANSWGLFDMHGNVREWVNDWNRDSYYNESPPGNDPPGPLFSDEKVARGGYFFSPAENCRSAARSAAPPHNSAYDTGFRVVLSGY